jgi:hypothetical protein
MKGIIIILILQDFLKSKRLFMDHDTSATFLDLPEFNSFVSLHTSASLIVNESGFSCTTYMFQAAVIPVFVVF